MPTRFIIAAAALENEIRDALEKTVPRLEVQNHLADGFVVADGHMHRIDTTLAHLAEYFSDRLAYCRLSISGMRLSLESTLAEGLRGANRKATEQAVFRPRRA
jgi:hypothetical protein